MNIKDELFKATPTKQAKRILAASLLIASCSYPLLGSLNVAFLDLAATDLEKVRWLVISIIILSSSLYLNLHFAKEIRSLREMIDAKIPELIKKTIEQNLEEERKRNHPNLGLQDLSHLKDSDNSNI